jgi:hypothetical protein
VDALARSGRRCRHGNYLEELGETPRGISLAAPGAWERAEPPNWKGREDPDEIIAMLEFIVETGWSLAWAPRVSLLRDMDKDFARTASAAD